MSEKHTSWRDVKAKGAALDPRSDTDRQAGQAAAAERREAYVRGHQLAEIRKAAGLTQAQVAELLGVSQARVSKIEHGEISGVDGAHPNHHRADLWKRGTDHRGPRGTPSAGAGLVTHRPRVRASSHGWRAFRPCSDACRHLRSSHSLPRSCHGQGDLP